MLFYFLDTDTYKIKFTEPTEKELTTVKSIIRWDKTVKYDYLLPEGTVSVGCSERNIDLHWTLETKEQLLQREYLFEL